MGGPKPVKSVEPVRPVELTKQDKQPVVVLARPVADWDCQKSVDFMNQRLALSGLVYQDVNAYPVALQAMGTTPAFVIPYSNPRMYRMRLDRAVDKYTQPKGMREVWSSPSQDVSKFRDEPILYLIEGELKAAAFIKRWPGLPAFGIGGAHNALIKTRGGTKRLLDALVDALKSGMRVVAIFDGDILTNVGIQTAAHNLSHCVTQLGCYFEVWRPPFAKGVDDWLVADKDARLADLVQIPLKELEESRKQLFQQLDLQMNDKGTPILNELNAAKILVNRFSETSFIDKRLGLINDGEIKSFQELEYEAVEYVQGELLAYMHLAKIKYGLGKALANTRRDLIQELFQSLKWDGVPRLNTWASKHFRTNFDRYTDEWGRLLITGLTLRVLEPGTKVDRACILVGAQGIGKSTFFEELAMFSGHSFYHACTDLDGGGDDGRTQGASFAKALVVDLAEGVIFETKKRAMDRAKQKLTQVHDEYREVYGVTTTIEKRGFVFVGTTNRMDQLSDNTGSRRFLPIEVVHIVKLTYHDKLQLIAEVVAKEDQIRNSNWFDIHITIEDAPLELRTSNPDITNIQTLVNSQFAAPDQYGDAIADILDSSWSALLYSSDHDHVQTSKGAVITANYILNKLPENVRRTCDLPRITRALSEHASDPTFGYRIIPGAAPYGTQLRYSDGKVPSATTLDYYFNGPAPINRIHKGYRVFIKPGHEEALRVGAEQLLRLEEDQRAERQEKLEKVKAEEGRRVSSEPYSAISAPTAVAASQPESAQDTSERTDGSSYPSNTSLDPIL